MLRTPAVVAACVALLLVAAGCTDDSPQPNYSSVSTSPTPSASPTPSGSDTPTDIPATGPNVNPGEVAPTPPEMALAETGEGAQAFETFYIRMVDWAYATSTPSILEPLYASGCTNCTNFYNNLTAQLAGGGSFRGSRITINQLALVTNDGRSGALYAVSVAITASAIQVLDSAGKIKVEGPASSITLTNWLARSGSSWVIVDQGKA